MRYCLSCNKKLRTGSYCGKCHKMLSKYKSGGAVALVETIHLKDYGKVSKKRIEELRRRVIVPHAEDSDGNYVVGRRGENGKIQEGREPSY